MKKSNWCIWLLLGLLSLTMAALLYVRFTPHLLVKVVGNKGREGQLGSICSCSQNRVLLEEIIDNDSGIGVEGGAGFAVQLKKLVVVNLANAEILKIGLSVNTTLIGCNEKTIWVFDPEEGIAGLSIKDGCLILDQAELLTQNPELKNKLSGTATDFSLSSDKNLVIADIEGKFWSLNADYKVYPILKNPEPEAYPQQVSNQQSFGAESLFYPISLYDANTGKAVKNKEGSLIFHYRNKLKEGLRLSLMNRSGTKIWTKDFDHLLNRKNEQCRPAAAYQIHHKVMLILATNRGTRLIWLDLKSGMPLKNLSV